MREIRRINRKYKKHNRKMTINDEHRLAMEAAAVIEKLLSEKLDKDENF